MTRLLAVASVLLTASPALAKNCKKGQPCGNTCISWSKNCHVGTDIGVTKPAGETHPTPPCAGHVAPRSSEAKKKFMADQPCPGGQDQGSTSRCRGFVVDHICPLVCCGLDAPQNMQWQTEAGAKDKDKWERDCSTCTPGATYAGERGP